MSFLFSIPCLFGLEGLVGDECRRMGLREVQVENGRVLFSGDGLDLARANLRLRCGERVLLRLGRFPARSFEELFQGVRALPWEDFLPKDANFPVKGHCLNSMLHSVPDCQKIIKKAAVERMKQAYGLSWFQETGVRYQIQFALRDDVAELYLDTSGAGLHKRGYRAVGNDAPLRETLAAALVELARYRGKGLFCDPMCGSGTILIEAALCALNRAPGLMRRFDAMDWAFLPEHCWQEAREEAKAREFQGEYRLWGGDRDPRSVAQARENARKAGVDRYLSFAVQNAEAFVPGEAAGTLVTNPPYGERMSDLQGAEAAIRLLGGLRKKLPGWTFGVISPHPRFESLFGGQGAKRRKVYNGMLQCNYFLYRAPRPGRPEER